MCQKEVLSGVLDCRGITVPIMEQPSAFHWALRIQREVGPTTGLRARNRPTPTSIAFEMRIKGMIATADYCVPVESQQQISASRHKVVGHGVRYQELRTSH